MSKTKRPVLKGGLLAVYLTFSSVILPLLALFFGRARESTDLFLKVSFYYALLTGTIVGFYALFIMFQSSKNKFGYAFIHNPEESLLSEIGMKWHKSAWKLIFIGFIMFSLFGLITVFSNQIWTGIPDVGLEQQITETAELIIAVQPASDAEVMGELFVMFLMMSIIYLIKNIYKLSKGFFWGMTFLIAIPMRALFAVAIHFLRYGALEGNLLLIFVSRYVLGMLTILTGSVIWEFMWHSFNNFFFKLGSLFADDVIFIVTIAIVILIGITGGLIWFQTRNKKQ